MSTDLHALSVLYAFFLIEAQFYYPFFMKNNFKVVDYNVHSKKNIPLYSLGSVSFVFYRFFVFYRGSVSYTVYRIIMEISQ